MSVARHSAACVCICVILQPQKKKKDREERDPVDVNVCARGCACAACVTVLEAESNVAHKRMSRELSQKGRQPWLLTLLPVAEEKSEEKKKKRKRGLPTSPRVFCHLANSLSIHLICSVLALKAQGATGFKHQQFNILTDPSSPPTPFPLLCFLSPDHLPGMKMNNS